MISSKYLAETFGLVHRDIRKRIGLLESELCEMSAGMFVPSSYVVRGHTYASYDISDTGVALLLQSRMFSSSPRHAELKSKILTSIGVRHEVVIGRASRFEDSFYSMLCDFVGRSNIIRQFPVLGYRVDFFIKIASVFIEFDEEQHLSKSAKQKDSQRWGEISKEIESVTGVVPKLIRVQKGGEVAALAKLAACICREAPDQFIEVNGIERDNVYLCK